MLFWIVLAALLAGLYARFVEPNLLVVRRLSFQAQGIAADCRVVFFTDTHFGEDKSVDSAKQLADRINWLEPDSAVTCWATTPVTGNSWTWNCCGSS